MKCLRNATAVTNPGGLLGVLSGMVPGWLPVSAPADPQAVLCYLLTGPDPSQITGPTHPAREGTKDFVPANPFWFQLCKRCSSLALQGPFPASSKFKWSFAVGRVMLYKAGNVQLQPFFPPDTHCQPAASVAVSSRPRMHLQNRMFLHAEPRQLPTYCPVHPVPKQA